MPPVKPVALPPAVSAMQVPEAHCASEEHGAPTGAGCPDAGLHSPVPGSQAYEVPHDHPSRQSGRQPRSSVLHT